MHRKVLSYLFILVATLSFATAQVTEDEDWYYNQPIATIEFQGLYNIKRSDLNGIISSFIDKPFTDDLYGELIDRLYALDFFEDFNCYVRHDHKDDSKVALIVDVVEKPIINSISFSGNHKIRNGELREKIQAKPSNIYVESEILLDERAIRNFYNEKGYSEATVTHTAVESSKGGVDVTFSINEGASTVISEIHFTGNTIVSERTLKNKIDSKEVGLFKDGAYQYSTLERDKQKIIAYYREKGYADASILDVIKTTTLNPEKQRNEMVINFIIQEGSQYTFKGLTISGNEVFSTEELLKNQRLKDGDVFNFTKLQEDFSIIQNYYSENGYMTNDYIPVPKKDSDRHEISYELKIVERSRSHVENIIIKGNTKTKDYVIRREFPLEPGDIFSSTKLFSGYRNLMNLQYFSNVIPEAQQGSEQNLVDVVLTVEEQSTSNLNFGMSFSGVTDPNTIPVSLFLKLENSNLFGEGKTLSTSTQISNTEQMIDLAYSQRWIGDLPIYFNTTLSLSHSASNMLVHHVSPSLDFNQNAFFSEYQGWSTALSASLGRRWALDRATLALSGGFSTSLNRNNYDESVYIPVDTSVSNFANRWGVANALYANFSVDARDLSYDPTQGWFASEKLTWHGLIPGVEKQFYLRSDTKLEGYLKLLDLPVAQNWNLKLVMSGYAGLSMLFPTSTTPLGENQKLFVDGMFNGRGWNYMAGQKTGNVMLSSNVELRIPLMPGVVGVDFFFDSVAIKEDLVDLATLNIDDFFFSFGPGIRFLMPQFPLHLMFAWRFKTYNRVPKFEEVPFQFVLSFNIPNR